MSPLIIPDRAHPPFIIEMLDLSITPLIEAPSLKPNFRKGDYVQINSYLNDINWYEQFKNLSVDEAVKIFYKHIKECIDNHIPFKVNNTKYSYPVWYSPALIKIIREKSSAHKRWKKTRNQLEYDEFSLLRARQKRIQAQCFKKYLISMQLNMRRNPKAFWTYIKSLRGGSNHPKSFTLENKEFSDGIDICNAFNSFFQSVFGKPLNEYNFTNSGTDSIDSMSGLTISKSTIEKTLHNLDTTKGGGSDGVNPYFWQQCSSSVTLPLYIIFNQSLQDGIFPALWKRALIVPIHKKGTKVKIENYKGISKLNTIGKLFEKIVYNSIYLTIHKSMSDKQHGFLRKRSTVTNLACFLDYVLENMDNGGQVDVIYTDFEKAFDRVDHYILLHKLERLGIHGDLLRWIKSYLSNRSQAVVVGGYRSDFIDIPTGVPQGSHLGPLFYCAYLYDIADCFNLSNHILYADDKKIYYRVKNQNDCDAIQSDLNNLSIYYKNNNINVNVNKCQCISFTRKRKPIVFSYHLNNVVIERVDVVKDLGILLDSKLLFNQHIDMIAEKAYKNLGFVLRSCQSFTDPIAIKAVYYAYVRSILEYARPIWSPQYMVYISRLERIQKIFVNNLNYLLRKSTRSYTDGCRQNNLLTLEERRISLDMLLLHDITGGAVDCAELVGRVGYLAPTRRTRHTVLLHVPARSTNYAANSVLNRLANTYNKKFSQFDIFNCSKSVFRLQINKSLTANNTD